jgi:DNA helicase HerA-like ATPase
VAALARPPAREVPGLRFVLRPDFDVTPETPSDRPADAAGVTVDPGGVALGTVLDWNRRPAGTLALPRSSLNRHTFVCGATGAGKSQTVRALLEAATGAGIPWLVVEPAKAEYAAGMAARLPGVEVIRIRPGEVEVAPAGINPLEPAPGPNRTRFPLQTHADLVRALFLAAFEADEPFPQVLAAALTRVYEQAGWDLATGEPVAPGGQPGYPSLADLEAAALSVVAEIGYGREITDNVRGFVKVRIASLRLGTTGRFLDGGHPLDFTTLLDRNVVLEIEDAGDDQDKAFLMGTALVRLAEHLRLRQRHEGPSAPGLRHLTVFEEAHRLLRQPQPGEGRGAAAHAVEMFASLLAEIRAYGEGLVIAEQIPAKLIPDVIKNTAVKITHRLPAADDREAVGATMNLTEDQSQYLVTLVPGEAAVFADGMDFPLLARMPDGTPRETSTRAATASPTALITPRSPSCGADCQAGPCTLRQQRAAQRAAAADPRLVLWAELSVLAHLTGWTMPMPDAEFAGTLRAMDIRLRDCALGHATDEAVAARAPVITATVSAPALAAHITTAMRAALDDRRWLCEQHEPQWLAPCYRWALVLDSLKHHHRRHQDAGPHPDTLRWEELYGQPIPGESCARQLGVIQRRYDAAQRDRAQVRAVAFGTRAPAAIEQAIGASATDDDFEQRLADSLTAFRDCRWPRDYLHPIIASAD